MDPNGYYFQAYPPQSETSSGLCKGEATNLKGGGGVNALEGGGSINTVKTRKFEKGGGAWPPQLLWRRRPWAA